MDERIEVNDRGKKYHADNDMTVETEVREFIGTLVSMIKPDAVLETGTYQGQLTLTIAAQLEPGARIYTCDTEDMCSDTFASPWWNAHIEFRHCAGVEMIEQLKQRGIPLDLVILDSGGNRLDEARAVLPIVRGGGVILIHDSYRMTESLAIRWLKRNECIVMEFDTPRGLAMIQVSRV